MDICYDFERTYINNVDVLLIDSWDTLKETPSNKSRKKSTNKANWAKNKPTTTTTTTIDAVNSYMVVCNHKNTVTSNETISKYKGVCQVHIIAEEEIIAFCEKYTQLNTSIERTKCIQRNIIVTNIRRV